MKRPLADCSLLLPLFVFAALVACDEPQQPAQTVVENLAAADEEVTSHLAARSEPDDRAVPAPAVADKKLAIKGPKDNEDLEIGRLRATPASAGKQSEKKNGIDGILHKIDTGEQAFGGLGLHGAARGGGGISERGIGLGKVGTVGRGSGVGYGKGAGTLGERRTRVPKIVPGRPAVAGYVDFTQDSASNTEGYEDHGTNKFTDPTEDKFSTFSIDVDTGSYTIARRKLNGGMVPPKASVRVEEFVNYFGYNYEKPQNGAFRVSMEAAPSPFATDGKTHLLRVGVQGKTIQAAERKPVHLTFLVDVSGSMRRPDKIGLVQESLRVLTNNLKEGDTVAIATYAGRTEILLHPTRQRGKILDAVERLSAGGSTAMESGLDLAYRLAEKNLKRDHENRVIVLSDGDANVGRTGWKDMLAQISDKVKKGITLSTIGFGMGNYQDTTMEQLANNGNGNYYYVDSKKEALKIFGDQLDGTMQVIAKDVKIQVEFNSDAVHRYRLVGYENRDIADKDFRNDKVDAGEIGAGHTVTALYEVELKDQLPERIATVRVRHKEPRGSDKAAEQAFGFGRDDIRSSIAKSSKDFQFAAAVAAFAEKLRESPYAKKLTYDWILEVAEGATKGRAERKEFVSLVKKAQRT